MGNRIARTGAVVVAVMLVLLMGIGIYLKSKIDPWGPAGHEVAVDISRGSTTANIAEQLAEKGVVTDAGIFRIYLKVRGGGPFEAGLYRLRRGSSMGEALSVLADGPDLPPAVYVTVPEGLTLAEIAARVHEKAPHLDPSRFLAAAASGAVRSKYEPAGSTNLEGFLFPETYRVEDREDETAVVRRMVETFDQVAEGLGYDNAQARVGRSPYETVIVASLVEAEAKSDEDRAKIARVIYNRLAKNMTLGIDAAFYYVLPLDRRGTGLRKSDLARDTPYNTRIHAGLVPTPIMAPSQASLEAALNPEPGPWLFYVLKDSRTHAFSSDYNQFLRDREAARQKGLL